MSKTVPFPASNTLVAQERLLPFLLNPKSYPHRPRRVRLVQTHSSFVFFAPPFVYKIKKPVNFGFLDFSTLEKRRHFCEREIVLNRRLSPRVYLEVVPIAQRKGRFTFGEDGEVVEYAVKMRKLPDGHFLDQMVSREEVRPKDLDRIVGLLKSFYEAQHPTQEIEAWGRIDRLRISTDENFRQIEEFVGSTVSRAAFEAIRFYTNQFYSQNRRLFSNRIRDRWIRDCHGDLHLDHIHLTPRAVNIYDCIEFNDRFRYVDVANDAAFLAMDLDNQGRSDLARYFARQLATALHDDGMLHLMDFYKCYRAVVRGKVESLHSLAHAAPEAEQQASADRARRYFRLALQYLVAGSQPLALVVMGRIASGKSTLAHALGEELGWEVYSSDNLRKKQAGVPLFERSSAATRTKLYSKAVTAKVYNHLLDQAERQLKKGLCVILDATFARRSQRELLSRRFKKQGFHWLFLEAQASDRAVKGRLRGRESNLREVSDARLEDFAKLSVLYEPPRELSPAQRIKVSTASPLDATKRRALQSLARIQLESAAR